MMLADKSTQTHKMRKKRKNAARVSSSSHATLLWCALLRGSAYLIDISCVVNQPSALLSRITLDKNLIKIW
ncbi:uncharacterized protein ARMOST_18898 [Armillaria ostoyae]|uniref:Uncharacterized protein n=1 Tax=Armillaria ostoyae TaxID=47428 RepID=A0A284S309_ARMOS|nr:uncharacterized protein ARMOST_18898 [Armillaria ostoyae]